METGAHGGKVAGSKQAKEKLGGGMGGKTDATRTFGGRGGGDFRDSMIPMASMVSGSFLYAENRV